MKKLVLASVMALASMSLVPAPTLRAQDTGGTITIKDPAEYAAYTQATTQSDPKAKAAALESFAQTYPQSVVFNDVLNMLLDTYASMGDTEHALSAANRLLKVDPNNLKAIFMSVAIDNQKCKKVLDPKTGFATDPAPCDEAAELAQKGLNTTKPTASTPDAWKNQTDAAYPVFDSAIAGDDVYSKKDFKAAIDEYHKELALYPADKTTSGTALVDTLNLAEAYVKLSPPDAVNAVWFYARVLNFAPASFKPQIEKKLDYWYNKYHGGLDGLDAIKAQAATTLFPPGTLVIKPAATPQEKIHAILESTPDLTTLALADKELVLAYGSKDDADKLWALMKDKPTPVPGTVVDATASVIKVAVTDDAKQAKTADFIVNLKTPLADKDIPAAGAELKLMSAGGPELDGTYDTYTQIPGTDAVPQSAQIVLREGFIQKKAPAHKPAAGRPRASSSK
jgi:tetratricopeptide (TPR) repeat protein